MHTLVGQNGLGLTSFSAKLLISAFVNTVSSSCGINSLVICEILRVGGGGGPTPVILVLQKEPNRSFIKAVAPVPALH